VYDHAGDGRKAVTTSHLERQFPKPKKYKGRGIRLYGHGQCTCHKIK
jgi:hypothetical protein